MHAAQKQARQGFQQNASLPKGDPAIIAAITHAEEVSAILRQNVVQGKHVGDDKYSKIESYLDHVCILMATPGLRIHEETERGDNNTIKMPNGQKVVIDGKTCAQK